MQYIESTKTVLSTLLTAQYTEVDYRTQNLPRSNTGRKRCSGTRQLQVIKRVNVRLFIVLVSLMAQGPDRENVFVIRGGRRRGEGGGGELLG